MARFLLILTVIFGLSFELTHAQTKANDVEPSEACAIYDSVIDFYYQQDEKMGPCGRNPTNNQKFCVRRSVDDHYIISTEFTLRAKGSNNSIPELFPIIKLSTAEKSNIKTIKETISVQSGVLWRRESARTFAKHHPDPEKQNPNWRDIEIEPLLESYTQRRIKGLTKLKGYNHPDVVELKKKLKKSQEDYAREGQRSDDALQEEVDAVDFEIFNILKSRLNQSAIDIRALEEATQAWNRKDVQEYKQNINCSGKITARKGLLWRASNEMVDSRTGEPLPKYMKGWHWHPKSMYPIGLTITETGQYAIMTTNGHNGMHVYSLGPPTFFLLEKNDGWRVIATSSDGPVFY